MRRRIGLITALTLAFTLGLASIAAATDNPGSCSINGGVVTWIVQEAPTEGSVRSVVVRSPARLDTTSKVEFFWNDDGSYFRTRYLVSTPIDGDGWWNYTATLNWTADSANTQLGRAYVIIDKYNSTSNCRSSTYF